MFSRKVSDMNVKVSFDLEILDQQPTATDLLEWIQFELGFKADLRAANTLKCTDIESCIVKNISIS
jgi:hypothetical protein